MSPDSENPSQDSPGDGGDGAGRSDEVEIPIEGSESPDPETRAAAAEARLRDVQEEVKAERDRFLRAAADLENFRKRAAREREDIQKFGNERLLKDLIPVLDNLDRALAATQESTPLADGVRLVRRMFEEALAKNGVELESALGKPFDPRRDEALAQVTNGSVAPGTVLHEHGRAVFLHGRLVRPAMVAVAAAPPDSPSTPSGDGG